MKPYRVVVEFDQKQEAEAFAEKVFATGLVDSFDLEEKGGEAYRYTRTYENGKWVFGVEK